MSKPKLESLQAYIKRQVSYDPSTGDWKWLAGPKAGLPAGLPNRGHKRIVVGGIRYKCSVLAVLYMTGSLPAAGMHVDHIDGDTDNNRWQNLRVVTHKENLRNQKLRCTNTSGTIGIRWSEPHKKWKVVVTGRTLGYYTDKLEAIAVRDLEYRRLGFHENHGRQL